MRQYVSAEGEFAAYRQLNFSFHHNMILPCPNKTLIRMYENALKPIKWCWNLSILWQSDRSLLPRTRTALGSVPEAGSGGKEAGDKAYSRGLGAFRKEYARRKSAGGRGSTPGSEVIAGFNFCSSGSEMREAAGRDKQ